MLTILNSSSRSIILILSLASHIFRMLCNISLQRIDHKMLSLTYKVVTTTQPPYLYNLISVQPHHIALVLQMS